MGRREYRGNGGETAVMGTTFTVIRGDGVTSHGVTVGMGSNADGNTAVECET